MALWTCGVFCPDLKSAKSPWGGEVHIGRAEGREEEEFKEDILHIFYVICSDTMLVKF